MRRRVEGEGSRVGEWRDFTAELEPVIRSISPAVIILELDLGSGRQPGQHDQFGPQLTRATARTHKYVLIHVHMRAQKRKKAKKQRTHTINIFLNFFEVVPDMFRNM